MAMRFCGISLCLILLFASAVLARDDDRRVDELEALSAGNIDINNDKVPVYDVSSNKLKQSSLFDAVSALGGYSGSGITKVYGDNGYGIYFLDGTGTAFFIVGVSGVSTAGGGNTIYVSAEQVLQALTAHTAADTTSGTSIDWSGGTTLSRLAGVTSSVQDQVNDMDSRKASLNANVQFNYTSSGASVFFIYSGVTLTNDMMAGGQLYSFAGAPVVVGVPSISSSTPFFMVKDMTGAGVTIQTTDGQAFYDGDDAGTALWIPAGYSRHHAIINCLSESGTCAFADTLGKMGTYWEMN